jgi:hypothetical protein
MHKLLEFIKSHWMALTVVALSAITALSLWPLDELPRMPGTDKTHHVIAYAVLMLPAALRKPDRWILIGLFFVGYGGAIELLQPHVNRYGEWLDFLANAAGVACGIVIAVLVNFFFSTNPEQSR